MLSKNPGSGFSGITTFTPERERTVLFFPSNRGLFRWITRILDGILIKLEQLIRKNLYLERNLQLQITAFINYL
ncbi:hypothetical protein D3H55_03000 [Bacillus salacetis]|uniref:Uncharacterized protein n=1 Tax=Bacillus salacetis TaxID=2315464 RepID=A0A3A1R5U1_9BACI|nr:hypothetical protein D3H55_03000 [Bacillus salacetis]